MKAFYSALSTLLKKNKGIAKIIFWITGAGSLLWFLIRVIPKPSRATYPCMRAAAPIMSGFVVYLLSLSGSVVAFRKVREKISAARYWSAFLFIVVAGISTVVLFARNEHMAQAANKTSLALVESVDDPAGIARGVHPGRVAWIWDQNVTNENCSNAPDDYWFMDKNTDQVVTEKMLADGIKSLSGQENCVGAWDILFRNFNYRHKKGWVGYQAGEKVVVKLNFTSMGNGARNLSEGMNSTPQLVLALLQQLIDTVGVAQSDISIGDPYRSFSDDYWDKCHTRYPNVHYMEGLGTDGREQTELTDEDVFFNSDDNFQSRLPKVYVEASYMINMPCMKSHGSAGITLAAKNHQGSVIGPDQDPDNQGMGEYLHYDYPDNPDNRKMGMYRHLVDFMAHKYLGENTLIFIVDAIWSGRDWFGAVEKWQMAPFNNDWTSSLFLSQDAVAIESVGFDFLYNEFKNHSADHNDDVSPTWIGVQDYIHQAADPGNWAPGIQYDPSNADHHAPVGSLGVHEHWSDATQMQYSQNLGLNQGIELVTVPADLVADLSIDVTGISVPATLNITGETTITAEITPADATNQDVLWESSNPTLAMVDQEGIITPLGIGNITITAMSADGNKRASTEVTIPMVSGYHQHVNEKCSVYPNPVNEYFTVTYTLSESAEIETEILTMDGKRVAGSNSISQLAGDNSFTMKLGVYKLADGMYICRVIARGANTHMYTTRLLIERGK
jgi:hypothetical protein